MPRPQPHHRPVLPSSLDHRDDSFPPHAPHFDWEIQPPQMASLRPWFNSDESAAAAYVAFTRCPAELRVVAELVFAVLPSPGAVEQEHPGTSLTPGGFFVSGDDRPVGGVPVPAVEELALALGGDTRLAYQVQVLLRRKCPEEIRALIYILVRAAVGRGVANSDQSEREHDAV